MIAAFRTAAVALTASTSLALAVSPVQVVPGTRTPLPVASTLFRHVTSSGTTKPPGLALDDRLGSSAALGKIDMRLGHLVHTAICTGC